MDSIRSAFVTIAGWLAWLPNQMVAIIIVLLALGIAYFLHRNVRRRLRLLLAEDLAPEDLRQDPRNSLPRLHGALLKNEQDVHLFERLAFLSRRGQG